MVEVNIPVGITKVTASPPLFQWDYGQILRITGNNLPSVCEVHFCNKNCKETIVCLGKLVDINTIETPIPDRLLKDEFDINAFIYVVGENCGNTIKQIHIPVTKRKKPEDYVDPLPEEAQTELETLIANINGTLNKIEGYYNETITQSELEKMIEEVAAKKATEISNNALTIANKAFKPNEWIKGTTGTSTINEDGYYMFRLIIGDQQFNTGIIRVSNGVNAISPTMFDLQDPTQLYQMHINTTGLVKAYSTRTTDGATATSFETNFYYMKVGE